MADIPSIDLSDVVIHAIGRVTVHWSALEGLMDLCILGVQKINFGTGLLLTANINFQSKMELVQLFASEDDFGSKEESDRLIDIVTKMRPLNGERNRIVHAFWVPNDRLSARRMGVRTKGGKLRTVDEIVTAETIYKVADEMVALGRDLSQFMQDHRLYPEGAPVVSKDGRPGGLHE